MSARMSSSHGPLAIVDGESDLSAGACSPVSVLAARGARRMLPQLFKPVDIVAALAGAQLYHGWHVMAKLLSALNCLIALTIIGVSYAMTTYDLAVQDKLRCALRVRRCSFAG